MAMADIAEDDLDEVMRDEAEDVFFQDGKACRGSAVRSESRGVGVRVGCRAAAGARESRRSVCVLCCRDQG